MKGKTLFGFVVFAAAAVLVAPPALAGNGNGWYIGGGTGTTSADVAVADFDDGGITSGDVDDGGVGFKLFGGYKFHKHFAVEGGYADLDEVAFAGTSDGTGGLYAAGPVTSLSEVDGLFVTAVGILPVAAKVSLFGKAGLMNWDGDFTLADSSGTLVAGSDDGSDPLFGVGVEIIPMEQFHIRAELERFSDIFSEDVTRVAGSLVYRF